MSGYNIEHFIKDFSERTKFNLDYIKKCRKENGPYEVTQMINSLLGIIILPVEKYKDSYIQPLNKDKARFDELKASINRIVDNCKKENRYRSTYSSIDNPFAFLRRLRNAVSHSGKYGLHFYPLTESGENISGIILYDFDDNHNSEFCIHLTIEELENLIHYATDLYILLDKKDGRKEKYEIAVEELEKFLKDGKRDKTVASIIEKRCDDINNQANNEL